MLVIVARAGGDSDERIKKLLTQNSKNLDERFFGNNSFSLVSLCNGNIQGFSAYYKISNMGIIRLLMPYHRSNGWCDVCNGWKE